MEDVDDMIEASVSGITFCKVSDEMWNELKADVELDLEREPTNQWDKNAIKVLYKGYLLGYIEKEVAADLARALDVDAIEITCKIIAKHGSPTNKPVLALGLDVR